MDILIYSDSARVRDSFVAIDRSKKHNIEFQPVDGISAWMKNGHNGHNGDQPALVYVDIAGVPADDRQLLLRRLGRLTGKPFAVIDPRNMVDDPASLIRGGATDYINRALFVAGIPVKRIDEIAAYLKALHQEPVPARGTVPVTRKVAKARKATVYRLSGDDWSDVQPAREYTFAMLFAELDNTVEYEAKTSAHYTASVSDSFRRLLEHETEPFHGRLWMWNDFGGVVLFPFNGRSVPAVLPCIRMVMNRPLDNVIRFDLRTPLSYRLSLHLGNTIYRHKGDTGEIISDAVNFVHHLGQQFTSPGNFTLTGEVHGFIPSGLADLFVPLGDFENRSVFRMRLPVRAR